MRQRLRELGYEPCSDGWCVLRSPEEQRQGMHTNGGCKCDQNITEKHLRMVVRQQLNRDKRDGK
jgi:hypothetical protein